MNREAGFTLIELLVSLTLLGLVFVLLFGGLRFGMRAWERTAANADQGESVRTAQDVLRGEIEQACPRRAGTPVRVRFSGDAGGVSFLGPLPGGTACAALRLQAVRDGNLERLVLRTASLNDALLAKAQSIDFAYLGPAGWQGGWSNQADLPRLVRLRVSFPQGDTRVWPELFIAPRISAEADCTYDPATKSCRSE